MEDGETCGDAWLELLSGDLTTQERTRVLNYMRTMFFKTYPIVGLLMSSMQDE